MRAYFKNDLYYAAGHSHLNQVSRPHPPIATTKPRTHKQKLQNKPNLTNESIQPKKILTVDDNLQIRLQQDSINSQKQKEQLQKDQLSQMLLAFSKKSSSSNKNILSKYTPKHNLKPFQQPKTAEKTEEEQRKQRIMKCVEFKKIEGQIKKQALIIDSKKQIDSTNNNCNTTIPITSNPLQIQPSNNTPQQLDSKQQQKPTKQGTTKTKMIKKQMNYVRLDLKRKYRDRFVGGINANLRYYGPNGRLKLKYRAAPNEFTIQDGELYNTYVSSLSKALTMDIRIDDSDNQQDSNGEGQQHSENHSIITPELPKDYSREQLKNYLNNVFGYQDFREGQFETITKILQGQSVVFVSETASGKSLTYIMSSLLMEGLSMVVSPLVSLILDQLTHLPSHLPAACISSLITRQQRDRIIGMVKSGAIKLLFITPESLQTDFLFHLQDFPPMDFVCVDEAHSLSQLSHNFRTSFLGLGEILVRQVKYKRGYPTILALTATANPETVTSIQQRLSIMELVRSQTCMNKNLFVTVSREGGHLKYEALIRYLQHPQINDCRGILVYTRTRKIMFEVFNFITNSTSLRTAIYHSALTNKQKTETLTKFREGDIKVVVATVALGMGLDFAQLECVIHINMPKSIQNYVQEIGRAGRRQRRAYCHLFLDANDYITERNYIVADQLQPENLVLLYQKLREYSKHRAVRGEVAPSKQEVEDMTVRRAALIIEHKGREQIIVQEQVEEDEEEQPTVTVGVQLKSKLFYIPIEKLTSSTQMRQQALLTLLLKVQSLLKDDDVKLKVLPVSHQQVKVSFFRKNQEHLREDSDFFRALVTGCRVVKGTIYINLIDRCNRLGLRPIELLTKLYRLGNEYTLKIQLENPIYVWRFEGKRKFNEEDPIQNLVRRGFEKLQQKECMDFILNKVNEIQQISLVKLNTFYTLAFMESRNRLSKIIQNNFILARSKPIPKDSIASKFDQYFRSGLNSFYQSITQNQTEIYIPTTAIEEKDKEDIYSCIVLFFKNQMNLDEIRNAAQKQEVKNNIFNKYQDGKTITKIFMGVNSGEVTWQLYGERSYWMQFKTKNYHELWEAIRQQLQNYKKFQLNR